MSASRGLRLLALWFAVPLAGASCVSLNGTSASVLKRQWAVAVADVVDANRQSCPEAREGLLHAFTGRGFRVAQELELSGTPYTRIVAATDRGVGRTVSTRLYRSEIDGFD